MTTRWRAAAPFVGVDLRALAAFRIGLGFCVLWDVLQRATTLRAHYTDAGILSRAEVLHYFAWLHEWPIAPHLMGGSTAFQSGLFLVHALAALALIVGYRATAAALLAWWLTSSVQLRNLYIGGGFDALLRMLLLWAVFLPIAARWSLDRSAPETARPPSSSSPQASVASIGTVALWAQMLIVYLAAGLAKAENELWWSGGALQLVLHDEAFATSMGAALAGWPALCRIGTWTVLGAELLGPLLLIACGPLPRLRLAVLAGLIAMNIGFGLTLAVGPFPWIATVGLLAFVPAMFWDGAERRIAATRLRARIEAWGERALYHLPPSPPRAAGGVIARFGPWICATVLIYTVGWNVAVGRDPGFEAPRELRWFGHALFLQQNWRMFARPSTLTGWAVIPGELVDGSEVDLLAAGGPVPDDAAIRAVSWEKPGSVAGQAANIRWRLLLRRVIGEPDERAAPQQYGRFLCREWNSRHRGDRQLARFSFVRIAKTLAPPYTAAEYERQTVWRHECFG